METTRSPKILRIHISKFKVLIRTSNIIDDAKGLIKTRI